MRMKIDAQVFHFYVKLVLQSRGKVGKCWYKYFLSMLLQIQRHLEETLAIAEGVEVGGGGLLSKGLTSDDLMSDGADDASHGGAAVVELGVALTKLALRLLLPVVPGADADAVVSVKLGGGPPGELDEAADKEDLEEASGGDLEEAADTRIDVGELEILGFGQVSVEDNEVIVDEGSGHGHHGNTAVLALDGAVADEGILISDVTEGVEEAEGGDGTELLVKLGGGKGGGGLAGGGRGEGGGGAGEKGEDGGGLHGFVYVNRD